MNPEDLEAKGQKVQCEEEEKENGTPKKIRLGDLSKAITEEKGAGLT